MAFSAPSRAWHVAFEGPIAAGKTTLATRFAGHSGAELILEAFETNPFLEDFYADRERWALPMQLDFLVRRYHQFSAQGANAPVVADHSYAKDRVFAGMLLSGREWELYDRVHRSLRSNVDAPTLVVFVDAPDEVLLERIRRRGRAYEQGITADYLQQVRAAYQRDLAAQARITLLHKDTTALDLESQTMMSAFLGDILAHVQRAA